MTFFSNQQYQGQTEQELLRLYKESGNAEYLSALYTPYMELLYGVCLKYLQDTELAKDAVLDIFEELIEKLRRHEVDYFKGWLYQVAKNHCLMKLRSAKKMVTVSLPEQVVQNGDFPHLFGENGKEEQFKLLQLCMDKLPAAQKRAVELFYIQQKCYNEIAEYTGIEWSKVRSYIQNGRRNLKICMEKSMSE